MTWTTIPDSNIEPGKAVRSVDMIAMRDNIPALANGDPGAPRINHKAIAKALTVNVGSVYQFGASGLDTGGGYGTSWTTIANVRAMLYKGNIRLTGSHYYGGGTGSSELRFLKNGVVLASYSTNSLTPQTRTFDTTVNRGDQLTFEVRGSTYLTAYGGLVDRKVNSVSLPCYEDEDIEYA